jgi:hypothetical protein
VAIEVCRNRRRDFFIRYLIYMPQQVFDEQYTLTLTIEDTIGHKIGQNSIVFQGQPD